MEHGESTVGSIYNCYNVGNVSAPSNVGSFTGKLYIKWTFSNCYNAVSSLVAVGVNQDVCSFTNSRKISEAELKGLANTLGSKYKNDKGINNGYPILGWQ